MEVIQNRASAALAQSLLILLPGAYMRAQDFVAHGFIDAARRNGQPIDIITADTGMECYLDGSIVERLHAEVVRPNLSGGARRIWLAGISLGGLGALLYAQAYPDLVEGLLLMSPFIGTRGAVAEVLKAGGFRDWQPPAGDAVTDEQRLLQSLKTYPAGASAWPRIYLGYGSDDRFAASYRLLAELLPVQDVVATSGGHDWETWQVLWAQLLSKTQFAADTRVP
jgi:pimeloyl-ACP methyl ester carboxylesterase